jgi:hypothetical protein
MLHHTVIGPRNGSYLVGYQTPGGHDITIACVCNTEDQATKEADRLNAEQVKREEELRRERELRGLDGVYPALDGDK